MILIQQSAFQKLGKPLSTELTEITRDQLSLLEQVVRTAHLQLTQRVQLNKLNLNVQKHLSWCK